MKRKQLPSLINWRIH